MNHVDYFSIEIRKEKINYRKIRNIILSRHNIIISIIYLVFKSNEQLLTARIVNTLFT